MTESVNPGMRQLPPRFRPNFKQNLFYQKTLHALLNLKTMLIQDAAEGDSGAPLYTLGRMDPKTQERTESKLVGLHTSGLPAFVFQSLRKKGIILPKFNVRVS